MRGLWSRQVAGRPGTARLPWRAASVGALCVALASGACTHSYIFGGDKPPRIADGQVVIERLGSEPEAFTVQRVFVQEVKGGARLPSIEEIRAWDVGLPTPSLDIIRVDVSTTSSVWRDWVMPGFGIGAGIMFLTVGGLGLIEPSTDSSALSMPFALLLAAVLGLEGALIGGGIGALVESGTTDMRLPGGAPLGPDAWPLMR